MNLTQGTKNNLQSLYYGLKTKIFQNQKLFDATIYLDNLWDHFLWITTSQNSFIVDLCFTTIKYYSLEFELDLKNIQSEKKEQKHRYLLLKEFNTQIPILFNEDKIDLFSSEQSISQFEKGRKPKIYPTFQKLIAQNQKKCEYSSNFSRYFKKLRISLELTQPQSYLSFSPPQIISALNLIDNLKPLPKQKLFDQNKRVSLQDAYDALKALYCRLNSTFLKSQRRDQAQTESKIQSSVFRDDDFKKLMDYQDSNKNYIVRNHEINPNLPLTDYFCFSSHNTYLTGNQITSDCKVNRYIQDLKKGIKCVELDVHNMGGNEPIITHAIKGKGFCKPITFRATIQAIDQFLEYNKDHYPIILSIENHASRQNQDLMNNILRKEFPKNILIPNDKPQFYKLSDTKGKIIVKTSCNLESLNQFKNNDETPKIKSYDLSAFRSLSQTPSQSSIPLQPNFFSSENEIPSNDDHSLSKESGEYQAFLEKIKKFKNLKTKFNERIDQNSYLPVEKIVQITCLFKAPKGIETPNPNPFECSSMQNNKIVKTPIEKIVTYTKKAFLRSYPEGTQIYSNNYDFLQLLIRGVQIIALNTQTNDDYAIMMNSYFRAGRPTQMQTLGYIQKPEYLRASSSEITVKYPNEKRNYEFAFYTTHPLEFQVYSLDNPDLQVDQIESIRVRFSLRHYNESFLVIKIGKNKWIECLPLRFLHYKEEKIFKTIIARDYEFEDTGVRILCSFKCTRT